MIYPSPATLGPLRRAHPSRTLCNLPAKPDARQPSLSPLVVVVRLLLWEREFSRATSTGSTNLSHCPCFSSASSLCSTHTVLASSHPQSSVNVVRSLLFVLLCVRHDGTAVASISAACRRVTLFDLATPILIPMPRYPSAQLIHLTYQWVRLVFHIAFPSFFLLHRVKDVISSAIECVLALCTFIMYYVCISSVCKSMHRYIPKRYSGQKISDCSLGQPANLCKSTRRACTCCT